MRRRSVCRARRPSSGRQPKRVLCDRKALALWVWCFPPNGMRATRTLWKFLNKKVCSFPSENEHPTRNDDHFHSRTGLANKAPWRESGASRWGQRWRSASCQTTLQTDYIVSRPHLTPSQRKLAVLKARLLWPQARLTASYSRQPLAGFCQGGGQREREPAGGTKGYMTGQGSQQSDSYQTTSWREPGTSWKPPDDTKVNSPNQSYLRSSGGVKLGYTGFVPHSRRHFGSPHKGGVDGPDGAHCASPTAMRLAASAEGARAQNLHDGKNMGSRCCHQ